ncbi:MAG: S9 family peptidase [Candidatus Aminicenantes bacterium]|nr:S9 family peptidase [Candidatus Aminicenantes bacterium]
MRRILPPALAALVLFNSPAAPRPAPSAAQEEKRSEVAFGEWLVLGPVPAALPAFHADRKKGFGAGDLLEFQELDAASLRPRAGKAVHWTDGSAPAWKEAAAKEGKIELAPPENGAATAYLAAYIETDRWIPARIAVSGGHPFRVFIDGRPVAMRSRAEGEARMTADVKIEAGTHLVLIKTVRDPAVKAPWQLRAAVETFDRYLPAGLRISARPNERLSLGHILDVPRAAGVSISPDGTCVALTMSQALPPGDDSESWLELFQIENTRGGLAAKLSQTLRGGPPIAGVVWAPQGKRFTYSTFGPNGGTIWLVEQTTGATAPLLRNIKNLGSHVWSSDGWSIIYAVSEEGEKDSDLAKRFQSLEDRQPGWRNRSHLYRLSLADGVRQRLTAGELSTDLGAVSPDNRRLLFTRTVIDYAERPFSLTELYALDLATLREELLWKGKFFSRADWSPNGKKILILGGPSAFGEAGTNVPKGFIPNDYDIQAYIFDPETKAVEAVSRDFKPSISRAFWPSAGESIYFLATDMSYSRIYEFNPARKKFSRVEEGVEVVEHLDVAQRAPMAVLIGSGAAAPPQVVLLDLQRRERRILKEPNREAFEGVAAGRVETWTFKNKNGTEIDGYVLYPPGFDPAKKYPLIVNYYGGTTPVSRDFGGRYPKALYAAQGYIVYVLQPSGAVGYGQSFSAFHVNDWGAIVADEIIDGVRKFLAAHAFVDSRRVGCIGASFGGFMTMLLLTKTNLFASAVSHAGISSISSYWGEGYWGYSYSAVAAADSFPWSRKDIFVNQSPLFNADKITTPLLLLHGSADKNVPPGESTQLFTALKLLGREVDYIQFFDQNHHILAYNKRILWTKTILAWFDRWLKGQPEWWFDLHPPR